MFEFVDNECYLKNNTEGLSSFFEDGIGCDFSDINKDKCTSCINNAKNRRDIFIRRVSNGLNKTS